MSAINWTEEVVKRKDDLIRDTQQFLQIKSVWEEESAKEGAPFGEGVEKLYLSCYIKEKRKALLLKI